MGHPVDAATVMSGSTAVQKEVVAVLAAANSPGMTVSRTAVQMRVSCLFVTALISRSLVQLTDAVQAAAATGWHITTAAAG